MDEGCLKCLLITFSVIFGVAGIPVLAVGLWLISNEMASALFEDTSAVFFTGLHIEVGAGALIMVAGFAGYCGKLGKVTGTLIQTVAGGAVTSVGLWLRFDKRIPFPETTAVFFTGVNILVAVGFLIMVVGYMGLTGAIKESKPWLGLFFGFMIVIFALDVAAATWAFYNQSKVVDQGSEFYKVLYKHYKDSPDMKASPDMNPSKEGLRLIHHWLNCCGTNGPEKELQDICPESVTKDCIEVIGEFFTKQLMLMGGLGVGIALVMIVGMVLSMCVCSKVE